MRLFLFTLWLVCSWSFAAAQPVDDSKAVKFDFQVVHVSQVVGLVYLEAFKAPYVLAPEMLKDERVVSFRFDAAKGDLRSFWKLFLDSLGYAIVQKNGVDFIGPKKTDESVDEVELFVYRPMHRPVAYLVDLLQAGFKPGAFGSQRGISSPNESKISTVSPEGSASSHIDSNADVLVFQGTKKDIFRFKSIVPSVDVPLGEVIVKAILYEVTTSKSEGSAFSLALSLLGGRFGINIGSREILSDSISIRTPSIDAAMSLFNGDSRFKTISTPSIRTRSGQRAQFMVGDEVPTLGSVSFAQGSNVPVQSVDYRSSGVILSVLPIVREGRIEMTVDQQISDFARTQNGVNNTPTLTKRSLSTSVSALDGELIVLGGLTQDRNQSSHGGQSFLPKFMRSSSSSDGRTEVLLLLQVTKI